MFKRNRNRLYMYNMCDPQDYPSVGQILDLLHEYDVTTIFAIQQDHLASYEVIGTYRYSETYVCTLKTTCIQRPPLYRDHLVMSQ